MPTEPRASSFVRALWTALAPGAALFLVMQVIVHIRHDMVGADSHAYWVAARDWQSWYQLPPAYRDAYLYSPAFAQALWPLGRLPWPVFQVVWMVAQAVTLAWLLVPLGWRRALVLAPFFVTELLLGNVYLFFAAALVLTTRGRGGALVLPLLTKVAPGCVGLWHVLRREWRPAAEAAAVTAVVMAVSIASAPQAWGRWAEFLLDNSGTGRGAFAAVRVVVSVLLVVVAARRGWSWLLAPALIVACPVLGGYGPLAVLAALPRLLQRDGAERRGRDSSLDEGAIAGPGTGSDHVEGSRSPMPVG